MLFGEDFKYELYSPAGNAKMPTVTKSGFRKKEKTAMNKSELVSAIAEQAARTGRNPQTGEEMQIAASKAPKFKAGKALKDAVNG